MTALNCKVGDLAIVVNTDLPENLGQIVEVLGVQTGEPLLLEGPGHYWQVRAVSGRKTLIYRYNDTGRLAEHEEGPAPDRCLRPVSGLRDGDACSGDLGARSGKPGRERPALPMTHPEAETVSEGN